MHDLRIDYPVASLRSPENYTGFARTQNFASPGGIVPGRPHRYASPAELRLNQWALAGDWTAESQAARLGSTGGRIVCRIGVRTFEITFAGAGAEAYAFTFD